MQMDRMNAMITEAIRKSRWNGYLKKSRNGELKKSRNGELKKLEIDRIYNVKSSNEN